MAEKIDIWGCPICRNEVQGGALMCPFCHAEIVYGLTRPEWRNVVLVVAAVVGFLGLAIGYGLPALLNDEGGHFAPGWGIGFVYIIVPTMLLAAAAGYSAALYADNKRRKQPPRFFPPFSPLQ